MKNFLEKAQGNGPASKKKKKKTSRVTGLGRKTRQEIGKVKPNASPEIPDLRETSDISSHNFGLGVGYSLLCFP